MHIRALRDASIRVDSFVFLVKKHVPLLDVLSSLTPPYFLLLKKARRLRQTTFHHVEHNDTQVHDVIIFEPVQLNHFEVGHSASRCGAVL